VARPLEDYLGKSADRACFIDVKGKFDLAALAGAGLTVWRL
jgi:hypothetical protein